MLQTELVAKQLPNRRSLAVPKPLNELCKKATGHNWQSPEAAWTVIERLRTDAFDHGVFAVGKNCGNRWATDIGLVSPSNPLNPGEEAAKLAQMQAIDDFVKRFNSGQIDIDKVCGLKTGYTDCDGAAWLAHWVLKREILPGIGPMQTPQIWKTCDARARAFWKAVLSEKEMPLIRDYKFIRGYLSGTLEVLAAIRGPMSFQRI